MSLRMRSHFHESHTQGISESIISLLKHILALRKRDILFLYRHPLYIVLWQLCAILIKSNPTPK